MGSGSRREVWSDGVLVGWGEGRGASAGRVSARVGRCRRSSPEPPELAWVGPRAGQAS
jgi:hypothetical protein